MIKIGKDEHILLFDRACVHVCAHLSHSHLMFVMM